MKKLALLVIAVLSGLGISQAQPFEQGSNVVGVAIGFGSAIGTFTRTQSTPGLSAIYERGIWQVRGVDVVSLGGYVGHVAFKNDYSSYYYSYTQKWNYTIIGVRGAYHYNGFTKLPKIDVYGGVMFSYNILNYKYSDNDPYDYYTGSSTSYASAVGATAFVGGRYFFNDHFGVYSELGYGVSFISAGACFKF